MKFMKNPPPYFWAQSWALNVPDLMKDMKCDEIHEKVHPHFLGPEVDQTNLDYYFGPYFAGKKIGPTPRL